MPVEFKPKTYAKYEVTCDVTYVWVVLSKNELQVFDNFDDALALYNEIDGAEIHRRVLKVSIR